MIQRIQSIYLVTGAVVLLVMMFLDPLGSSDASATLPWFIPVVLGMAGLSAAVAVVAIFLYKGRRRQEKVVLIAQVLTLFCVLALYGGLYLGGDLTSEIGRLEFILLLILPILAYIQFHLARRRIHRDIELIKSMDRLR